MANTDKHNFKYPSERWVTAMEKLATMRDNGYDIDMTKLLSERVDWLLDTEPVDVARTLGIVQADGAVPLFTGAGRGRRGRSEVNA